MALNETKSLKPESLFDITAKLVMEGNKNIFLTGKAGTGKTTFLKYIRENCSKNLAVVAPTGVAAINAGGVTIHSFFQIPFSPFIPEADHFSKGSENLTSFLSRLKIRGEKKKLIRELELLIIDEVSMVRCDVLDAIDCVLRFIRRRPEESFGGVQMLFIGDMFQLPPVVKDNEWMLLNNWYNSPYFFESLALRKSALLSVEFEKIYRQSDSGFIELLNKVRNNCLDGNCSQQLEKLYRPSFKPQKNDGFVILTTHNEKARTINTKELNAIASKTFNYEAVIEDEFPEHAYPADTSLTLKVGAQVMFIKNDSGERGRRYFNGKIGTVTLLEQDKILVKCEGDATHIEVKREKWENIKYVLNHSSREIEEETLGTFQQFPLRLAWAITIHKSQGLTFEKAIIDAAQAFAPGQVYVALSRCTTLEGIVLLSRIPVTGLSNDPTIIRFCERKTGFGTLQKEAAVARETFTRQNWLSTFHFGKPFAIAAELTEYVNIHRVSFESEDEKWASDLTEQIREVENTARKFRFWLQQNFDQAEQVDSVDAIQEKTKKAVSYFSNAVDGIIGLIRGTTAQTDSYLHAKEFNEQVKELFATLSLQKHLVQSCKNGFRADVWQQQKKNFSLPPFKINAHSLSGGHTFKGKHHVLQQRLRSLRDSLCAEYDLPVFRIAKNKSIEEMAEILPQNLKQLEQVYGFGKAKANQFGRRFVDIIKEYCEENNVTAQPALSASVEQQSQRKKEKKSSGSQTESLHLFLSGKTVQDVAAERKLAISTIEGHLAMAVKEGMLDVSKLLTEQQLEQLENHFHHFDGKSAQSLKDHLPDMSYAELRFFINHKRSKESAESAGLSSSSESQQ